MFRLSPLSVACVTLALSSGGCAPEAAPLVDQSLTELARQLSSSEPYALDGNGIGFAVEHQQTYVKLPLPGASEVVLDCVVDGTILLSYFSDQGHGGPPTRYVRLFQGPSQVHLDMLRVPAWTTTSRPVLELEGTGHVTLRRVQARGLPPDPAAAHDRASLFAPESAGHTTINALSPVVVHGESGTHLASALAALGAVLFVIAAIAAKRMGRSLSFAAGLTIFAVTLAWNVHFLVVRFLPMLRPLKWSTEERIKRNYAFEPEVGELAAMARATIDRSAKVGVLTVPSDWFAWQALCFNLAPRKCVRLTSGAADLYGLGSVTHLHPADLDVVVSFHAADAPVGFEYVAGLSPSAFIAKRK